jgi:hypothetical protein
MSVRRCSVPLLLAGVSLVLAEVPPYSEFQLQARSNIVDGYNLPANSSFNSKTPTLNDVPEIAFTLVVVGGGSPGLFVGSDGAGTVVYTGPSGRVLSDPSIDASGKVVFDRSDVFSEGIYLYDPVSGQTTLEIPATTFDFAAAPTLLDAGQIAFRAGQTGSIYAWRLFDGGTTTTYVAHGGEIAYLFTPSTNNQARIAGKVRLDSTAESAPDQIRAYSGPGAFAVLAEDADSHPASPYDSFDNSVSQADDGRVAFIADLVAGGRGVFLTDGTTTATIATLADPRVSEISFFRPAANSSGLVAFRGTDDQGLDAIFVGDGIDLERVVGEHDLVEIDLGTARIDQHDDSVVFGGSVAINERGEIAFNAALTPADNDQIEWGSGMFVALTTAAPPPVPDGKHWGSPVRVGKLAGGDILVRWDVRTCPGDDYNLFFGDLANVSSGDVSAAACSLGLEGVARVTPPSGDAFFVLASVDDAGMEGVHGFDSAGRPRPWNGVGFCGVVEQSLEGTCR